MPGALDTVPEMVGLVLFAHGSSSRHHMMAGCDYGTASDAGNDVIAVASMPEADTDYALWPASAASCVARCDNQASSGTRAVASRL